MLFAAFFILSPLSYAADGTHLPVQVRDQIETQTREMSAVGIPTDVARNMLTMMHQNRFKAETIDQAQQVVMNCAEEGLPTEPVMSKAMEGMAKHAHQASPQQIASQHAGAIGKGGNANNSGGSGSGSGAGGGGSGSGAGGGGSN